MKDREILNSNLKRIELDTLLAVHQFCEENNLKYYLWGGTLLGAIRHNGFIPWDDDIDIAMFRADFEVLLSKFGDSQYGISSCEIDNRHPYWHAKIYNKGTRKIEPIFRKDGFSIGVDIDVFVLDSYEDFDMVMETSEWREKQIEKYWMSLIPLNAQRVINRIRGCIYRNIIGMDANKIARTINNLCLSFGDDGCGLMLYADVNIKKPLKLDKKWFENRELHAFENVKFYVPGDYDALLRACYGDYMITPPMDKRITHHSFKAYYI